MEFRIEYASSWTMVLSTMIMMIITHDAWRLVVIADDDNDNDGDSGDNRHVVAAIVAAVAFMNDELVGALSPVNR